MAAARAPASPYRPRVAAAGGGRGERAERSAAASPCGGPPALTSDPARPQLVEDTGPMPPVFLEGEPGRCLGAGRSTARRRAPGWSDRAGRRREQVGSRVRGGPLRERIWVEAGVGHQVPPGGGVSPDLLACSRRGRTAPNRRPPVVDHRSPQAEDGRNGHISAGTGRRLGRAGHGPGTAIAGPASMRARNGNGRGQARCRTCPASRPAARSRMVPDARSKARRRSERRNSGASSRPAKLQP
jgi:hypothetical protein